MGFISDSLNKPQTIVIENVNLALLRWHTHTNTIIDLHWSKRRKNWKCHNVNITRIWMRARLFELSLFRLHTDYYWQQVLSILSAASLCVPIIMVSCLLVDVVYKRKSKMLCGTWPLITINSPLPNHIQSNYNTNNNNNHNGQQLKRCRQHFQMKITESLLSTCRIVHMSRTQHFDTEYIRR